MKKDSNRKSSIPGGVIKSALMNHLAGRNSKEVYLEAYLKSLDEAYRLLDEAIILFDNKSYQRSYFLGFSALEEISKSQLSADVYTGFITEDEFKKVYRNHNKKINRVKWIQIDGNSYPYFEYDKIKIEDFNFQKKLKSMYVDINFCEEKISSPKDCVSEKDASNIIQAVKMGLFRIYQVTEEDGEQIGTRGFMK